MFYSVRREDAQRGENRRATLFTTVSVFFGSPLLLQKIYKYTQNETMQFSRAPPCAAAVITRFYAASAPSTTDVCAPNETTYHTCHPCVSAKSHDFSLMIGAVGFLKSKKKHFQVPKRINCIVQVNSQKQTFNLLYEYLYPKYLYSTYTLNGYQSRCPSKKSLQCFIRILMENPNYF